MTTATKKRFPRLSSSAFEHPADRAALDAVKKIPLLDKIFTKLIELGAERALRITMMGRAVHVTPKQCPKIYKLFREACDILDMPEPDLFIISNPQPNAFTLGVERPIIAVHSGLIDLLTEEELMGVLGHELGHIKAGHVLYKTIAYFLLQILTMVFGSGGTLAEFGLSVALYDWSRKSELTADRAELLVTQNLETCIRTHMKLAGGSMSSCARRTTTKTLTTALSTSSTSCLTNCGSRTHCRCIALKKSKRGRKGNSSKRSWKDAIRRAMRTLACANARIATLRSAPRSSSVLIAVKALAFKPQGLNRLQSAVEYDSLKQMYDLATRAPYEVPVRVLRARSKRATCPFVVFKETD